jgi:hypothetical protein
MLWLRLYERTGAVAPSQSPLGALGLVLGPTHNWFGIVTPADIVEP